MSMMPQLMGAQWAAAGANPAVAAAALNPMSVIPGVNNALLESMLSGSAINMSDGGLGVLAGDVAAAGLLPPRMGGGLGGGPGPTILQQPVGFGGGGGFGGDNTPLRQQLAGNTSLINLLPSPLSTEKVTAAKPPNGVLVYDDDLVSMEEKRAALPKYNYRLPLVIAPLGG